MALLYFFPLFILMPKFGQWMSLQSSSCLFKNVFLWKWFQTYIKSQGWVAQGTPAYPPPGFTTVGPSCHVHSLCTFLFLNRLRVGCVHCQPFLSLNTKNANFQRTGRLSYKSLVSIFLFSHPYSSFASWPSYVLCSLFIQYKIQSRTRYCL